MAHIITIDGLEGIDIIPPFELHIEYERKGLFMPMGANSFKDAKKKAETQIKWLLGKGQWVGRVLLFANSSTGERIFRRKGVDYMELIEGKWVGKKHEIPE